ncbi:hypothetical protein [Yunchengibacter salinarum]|uniref:hypothetical protein n=1 Tax=Yunchengibacter salinarum TaxID=3133399 RepID=UPI0035B5B6FA
MILALVLSVLILLTAPALTRALARTPVMRAALDGFVLMVVVALVGLTLLPEAVHRTGSLGLAVALMGFILPGFAERVLGRSARLTHAALLAVAALALVLHAASDGAVLALAEGGGDGATGPGSHVMLAVAVVLHRLGVATAVWWLLKPHLGRGGAYAALIGMAAMTVAGFFLTRVALQVHEVALIGTLQAFAAGSLLHVILHPLAVDRHPGTDTDPTGRNARRGARLGTGAGLAIIALVLLADGRHGHGGGEQLAPLLAVGRLLGPVLGLMLLFGLWRGRRSQAETETATEAGGLMRWSAISLALLLLIVMLSVWWPGMLPAAPWPGAIFGIWAVVVLAVLVHQGARRFFQVLTPLAHAHDHTSAGPDQYGPDHGHAHDDHGVDAVAEPGDRGAVADQGKQR